MVNYNLSYLSEIVQDKFRKMNTLRSRKGVLTAEYYQNAGILPCLRKNIRVYDYAGGVVTSNGHFISGSGLHEPPCLLGGEYPASFSYFDEVVIYIGFLLPEWGNTITDSLKKLWFLHTEQGRQLLRNGAQVVYVTFENVPLMEYQIELFRLAGFDATVWKHVVRPTRYREVVIPNNSMITTKDDQRFYYPEFVKTVQTIKEQAVLVVQQEGWHFQAEKIYLTRTLWKQGRDSNEKKVENLFRRLGYRIIAPEQFRVAQQIAVLSACSRLAVTEGSIAHNALFLPSGAELVILQKADYINDYQMLLNELADLKVTYIPAHASTRVSKEMPWAGPFYLTITPALRAWSGLDFHIVPVFLQPAYWKYAVLYSKCVQTIKLNMYLVYQRIRSQIMK